MFIRSLESCAELVAGDGTRLRELVHGPKDKLKLNYSLAQARLAPGNTSHRHRLLSSEIYYLLAGQGRMEIDGKFQDVSAGDTIYIPPGSTQGIANTGLEDLVFLCIVDPAWRKEDEEIEN